MNKIEKMLIGHIQHYNHERYWKYRRVVIYKNNTIIIYTQT